MSTQLPTDLQERLLADPEDVEAYLVGADWLQARGDPRGELIALQHGQLARPADSALRAAQSELVRTNARHLLGRAADHLRHFCCDWQMGHLRSLRMFGARDFLGREDPPTLGNTLAPAEEVLGALLQRWPTRSARLRTPSAPAE